jgi:hypothetical protein
MEMMAEVIATKVMATEVTAVTTEVMTTVTAVTAEAMSGSGRGKRNSGDESDSKFAKHV